MGRQLPGGSTGAFSRGGGPGRVAVLFGHHFGTVPFRVCQYAYEKRGAHPAGPARQRRGRRAADAAAACRVRRGGNGRAWAGLCARVSEYDP